MPTKPQPQAQCSSSWTPASAPFPAMQPQQFEKVKGNSRQTWKLINEIRGKQKTKIKPSFIIDGTLVEERRVIADSFNKYFTSIASKLNQEKKQ